MRRKKHKHTRRAVAFYRLNYGFHEPYKVLLDGNFIHAAIGMSLQDLDKHVSNLLGGRVKLYVTRCISNELKQMGADTAEAYKAARSYELHKCSHEASKCTPASCIRDAIGEVNDDRWWVATQDSNLRTHLEQMPSCPVLFATINGIHLHSPPGLAKDTAKEATQAHQALPDHEKQTEALKDLDELRPRIKTSAVFRRKKAKGPNPLAVQKKKKKSGAPNNTDAQAKNTTAHTGAGEGAQPGHAPQGVKRAREDTGTGREGVQQENGKHQASGDEANKRRKRKRKAAKPD